MAIDVIEVFCSYSHKDEELKKELEKHLSAMKRQGLITLWSDRKIDPGTGWKEGIDSHLESAEVILLLISADFIASDYCYEKEMMRALQRHKKGEARTIPIILREVDWKEMPFSSLQALPKDGKAIRTWDDRDKAFAEVARGIRQVVEQLRSERIKQATPNAGYWKLVLDGTIEDIDRPQVETILSTLRGYVGNSHLQFQRIVDGSVVCVFFGSRVGFDVIQAKIESRELIEIAGLRIARIQKLPQISHWEIDNLGKKLLGVFPVFSRIPAGKPYPIAQMVTGYINTDRFIIDGEPYYIAVGSDSDIRLGFSFQIAHIAFRVDGDSMNLAGINDGDYVLLRVSSVTGTDIEPANGDIVAVALPETDEVTLKRFHRILDQVVFEPDSTNSDHASYSFKTSQEYGVPFKIVGVHVATLKPLRQN